MFTHDNRQDLELQSGVYVVRETYTRSDEIKSQLESPNPGRRNDSSIIKDPPPVAV